MKNSIVIIYLVWLVISVSGCAVNEAMIQPLSNDLQKWEETKKITLLPDKYRSHAYYDVVTIKGKRDINYDDISYKKAEIIGEYKEAKWSSELIAIRIEKTGQLIAVPTSGWPDYRPKYVGFQHEMESAKEYIGKNIWAKPLRGLRVEGSENKYLDIKNLEKLTLIDTKWSESYKSPIRFIFKTDSGEIGYWDGYIIKKDKGIMVNNLWNSYNFYEDWYLEDPRQRFPAWSENVWKMIEGREVFFGMTQDMAIMSWGVPKDKNRSIGSWGVHEQWVYGNSSYLYFENGKLRSIQD